MTDYTEITGNYKALLNMCDTKTAADVIMFRSDELTEKMLVDIMYSMKGELMLRQMDDEWESRTLGSDERYVEVVNLEEYN